MQQSSALKSLVAFFPFVHKNGDSVGYHDDDIQYDFRHLQLLGDDGDGKLITNWYLLPLSDLPRTLLVVQDGEANAAAALKIIQNIDSYEWLTYARWDWQVTEIERFRILVGVSTDCISRVYHSLKRLPMLLNRAAYSSDLINALPSNTVHNFDEYSPYCHKRWCDAMVAIKSYLNRHGVSLVKSDLSLSSGIWQLFLYTMVFAYFYSFKCPRSKHYLECCAESSRCRLYDLEQGKHSLVLVTEVNQFISLIKFIAILNDEIEYPFILGDPIEDRSF